MTRPATAAFDAYRKNLGDLITGGQVVPAWAPDASAVAFVDGPADERRAWVIDLSTGDKAPLFDVPRARRAIATATGQTPPGQGVPFEHFGFAGPRQIVFQLGADTIMLDLDTLAASKLPAGDMLGDMLGISEKARMTPREFMRTTPLVDPMPAHELMSPDAQFHLSTVDHNIVVRSTYDGRKVQLTDDGTPEHEWRFDLTNPLLAAMGLAVPTTNWSPDGKKIAVYRVDNRGVAHLPQVHYLKRDDEVVRRYHTKAGGVLERSTLHVLDIYGQPRVDIDLGDTRDTYPVFAAWLPDGSELILFRMTRDCRQVDIVAADPTTGAVRQLFTEKGDTFIRIHHDVYFARKLGLTLTPDGEHLLWLSERSGWNRIDVHDLQGKLLRTLTEGEWPVDRVVAVRGGYVYFTGHRDQARPYDLHFYRVPLAGGEVEALTETAGVHDAVMAPGADAFLDTHSQPHRPPTTELRRLDGTLIAEVTTADIAKLRDFGWTAPEEFAVTAADGQTELWGVMFKPGDFDAAKKYPVVEYIYGGPQIAVAPHGFTGAARSMGSMAQAIAQLGYVTVMLDARGTPGRSKEFHDAIYRRWANCLADDHAEAIKQLAARHSFMDLDRVGITGGSWGGYSAFRCLADRPDIFKAAVSFSPGFDPFSSVLYECYLDLPQRNLDGYNFANVLNQAARLSGEFMIACGTSDHATWTDAIKMTEALIRASKQHEFVVLPEQYHGYDSVHDDYLWTKVAAFFDRCLGQPTGSTLATAPEVENVRELTPAGSAS